MTKFRKSLLVFGILALIIGVALGTFIVLSLTGSLKAEPIALEFTVDDAQKEYDGEPLKASSYSITDGYLVEGHTPVISFTGEQSDVGVSLSGLDVKIVDEKGYDVTGEYKIKVNGGLLAVAPCSLQIRLTAQDVIYDGTAVDIGNDYIVTGGALAKGHKLFVQIKDEWFESAGKTVAGKTLGATDVDLLILDGSGRNVTDNYAFMFAGKVNIIKRPLVLTPVSAEKTYDGKPLECSQYNIESGSLAAGHYIVPVFEARDGTAARVTDFNAEYPLETVVKATVYDMDGDDVSDNYDLRSNVGYLTVNRANLTVTAKSGSWIYDGLTHSLSDDVTAGSVIGLVYGDTLTVSYSGSVTDVSVEKNTIEKYFINGNENNQNYNVTLIDGELEVTKAPLTVTLKNLEKEYDGEPFEIKDQSSLYDLDSGFEGNLELQFKAGYVEKLFEDITGVVNSTYSLNEFDIYNGAEKVTDKFNVTVIPGNLKITRKAVTLNTDNLTKTYDGNFIFTDGISFDKDLASGHRLESVTVAPVSSVGSQATTITSLSVVDALGNSAIGYYNISYDSSITVTINARSLEISSKSDEKVYDGTPLKGGDLLHGSLVSGDRIVVIKQFEITDCCEETEENNNVPEFEIRNSNDEVVTEFYDIEADYGTLTVTQKRIKVYLAPCEIEYLEEGITELNLFSYIRCDGASAENFGVRVATFKPLGKQSVERFYWRSEPEFESNYLIEEGNKEFEIVKKRLTASINAENACKSYNAKAIEKNDLGIGLIGPEINADALENFGYVSSNLEGLRDAGNYDAEIIFESDYERLTVTGCYIIKPLNVRVKSNKTLNATYNGLPFVADVKDLYVTDAEAIVYDFLSVKSYTSGNDIINVTEEEILKFRSIDLIISATGESVKSSNVTIDFDKSFAKVTINQRKLTVTLDVITCKASDVNALNSTNLTGIIKVSNLADGDNMDFGTGYGVVIVSGDISMLNDSRITIKRDKEDVTSNYDIPKNVMGAVIFN